MTALETANSIIDRIGRRLFDHRAKQMKSFLQLTSALADGKPPRDEEITEALAAAERTHEDLRASVALLLQRRSWAKAIAEAEAGARERPALAAKIADANKRFEMEIEAARLRGVEICQVAETRLRQLDALDRQAEAARNRLADNAPQAALDELALIKQERAKVNARAEPLEKHLRATEAAAAAGRAKLKMVEENRNYTMRLGATSSAVYEHEGADEVKRVVAGADAEAGRIREQIAGIRAEEKSLREREEAASAALLNP